MQCMISAPGFRGTIVPATNVLDNQSALRGAWFFWGGDAFERRGLLEPGPHF